MNNYVVLIDFGSTFTKMVVVDREKQKVVSTINYPSTVDEDANIALNYCLDYAKDLFGSKVIDEANKYASSSAAGGLRIAVMGITENLSIKAGKNVAFGSGGKIIHQVSGKINKKDIDTIKAKNSEIILLSGGYDYGNTSVVRHNAEMLAISDIQIPIIYSGNNSLSTEVYLLMRKYNKNCCIVSNILPSIGIINNLEAEKKIRDIFMKRIIHKKGLSKVAEILKANIIPTPAAVLMAGELLSKGTNTIEGLGELIIADVGGATTDIHSFSKNYPYEGAKIIGAEEPYAKRTVEGDLGMRESSDFIIKEFNTNKVSNEIDLDTEEINNSIKNRRINRNFLANSEKEKKLDQFIAAKAVNLAIRRHVGYIEPVHYGSVKYVQHGKNLSNVKTIIGTGGQLAHSTNPNEILINAKFLSKYDNYFMLPKVVDCKVDYNYILYSLGLISMHDPNLAMTLLKNNFMTNE